MDKADAKEALENFEFLFKLGDPALHPFLPFLATHLAYTYGFPVPDWALCHISEVGFSLFGMWNRTTESGSTRGWQSELLSSLGFEWPERLGPEPEAWRPGTGRNPLEAFLRAYEPRYYTALARYMRLRLEGKPHWPSVNLAAEAIGAGSRDRIMLRVAKVGRLQFEREMGALEEQYPEGGNFRN